MIVWPYHLWPAPDVKWTPDSVTASGGLAANGLERFVTTDGGGKWTAALSGIWLHKRDHLLAMRAIEPALMRRETILLPSCECRFKPTPAGILCRPLVPHSDGSTFSDGTEYESGAIEIRASAADLRAIYLTLNVTASAGLRGGEHFSINHRTKGRRMYRIESIQEDDASRVRVWPPLRENIPPDTVLDFDQPGCVMRCTNPSEVFGPINLGRFSTANAMFVEAF